MYFSDNISLPPLDYTPIHTKHLHISLKMQSWPLTESKREKSFSGLKFYILNLVIYNQELFIILVLL